jgi:hypothetical protein
MSEVDYPLTDVAVSVLTDKEGRVCLPWNDGWGAFALPMTKRRRGEGILEPERQAALRAAAEAMGVPCKIGDRLTMLLEQLVSERDHRTKRYTYRVYRAQTHPPDANRARIHPPAIWLTPNDAFSGDCGPITQSSLDILSHVVYRGHLPGRVKFTSALVIKRRLHDEPEFLLRYNRDWGYALPTKAREPEDDPLEVARQVALQELDLRPGADIILSRPYLPTFNTCDMSERAHELTYYHHSLFWGELQVSLGDSQPLVWATRAEIAAGRLGPGNAGGVGAGREGEPLISRTVARILSALGQLD